MRLMHARWKHDKRIRKSLTNSNQLLSHVIWHVTANTRIARIISS